MEIGRVEVRNLRQTAAVEQVDRAFAVFCCLLFRKTAECPVHMDHADPENVGEVFLVERQLDRL